MRLLRSAAIAAVALILSATPMFARAGASITSGAGPFFFSESYATEAVVGSWVPKRGNQPDYGYWTKIECFQAGSIVYAQWADLPDDISDRVVQSGFTFGPTPSWSGGAVDCHLLLYGYDPYRSPNFALLATSGDFAAAP